MPLLDENPWETVYVMDEDIVQATWIMPVPGGLLVRVDWWEGTAPSMTSLFIPGCTREQFFEMHRKAVKR